MSKFNVNVAEETLTNYRVVHKFGRNPAVGTTLVPVSVGGIYRTPQVGSETTLRIAAGDVNDTAAGTGARKVLLFGINGNGDKISEELTTAGLSAGAASTATFLRLWRAYVTESGTYADQSTGSHAADIVIENGAGGTTWATIDSNDYPKGQTEIGVYSVPVGKKSYIMTAKVFADSNKITNILFFQRQHILQTAAPFDAMRVVFEETLEAGQGDLMPLTPIGPFSGPCDLGFMAKVDQTTSAVEVDFEVLESDG